MRTFRRILVGAVLGVAVSAALAAPAAAGTRVTGAEPDNRDWSISYVID